MQIDAVTIDTKEAAKICGYSEKYPWRFLKEVKEGRIPGIKYGRGWRFYIPDLIANMRNNYATVKTDSGTHQWQSTKRKAVHISTQDSLSAESMLTDRLKQVKSRKRKSMKINL